MTALKEQKNLVDFEDKTVKKELLHRFLKDQEELLSSKRDTNNNTGIPDIVVLQDEKDGVSSFYEDESDPENSNFDGLMDNTFDDDFTHYSSCSSIHRYSVNSNFSPTFDEASKDFRPISESVNNRRGSLGVLPSEFQSTSSLSSKYYSQDNLAVGHGGRRRFLRAVDTRDRRRLSCDIAELTRVLNDAEHKLPQREISDLHKTTGKLENTNRNLAHNKMTATRARGAGSADAINYSQLSTLPPINRFTKRGYKN